MAGSGAGQESTASGLISDLVYLSNVRSNSSINLKKRININIQPIDEMEFKYFFKIKTLSKDFDLNKIEKIFQKNQFLISAENFDDFYIVIISESFIENKKDSIMLSLNNLSEVDSVKSIRIEP